jgi:hypothetical protein
MPLVREAVRRADRLNAAVAGRRTITAAVFTILAVVAIAALVIVSLWWAASMCDAAC